MVRIVEDNGGRPYSAMESYVAAILVRAGIEEESSTVRHVLLAVRTLEQALAAKTDAADRLVTSLVERRREEEEEEATSSDLKSSLLKAEEEMERLRLRETSLEGEVSTLTGELKGLAAVMLSGDDESLTESAENAAATANAAAKALFNSSPLTPESRLISSPGSSMGGEGGGGRGSSNLSPSQPSSALLAVLRSAQRSRSSAMAEASSLALQVQNASSSLTLLNSASSRHKAQLREAREAVRVSQRREEEERRRRVTEEESKKRAEEEGRRLREEREGMRMEWMALKRRVEEIEEVVEDKTEEAQREREVRCEAEAVAHRAEELWREEREREREVAEERRKREEPILEKEEDATRLREALERSNAKAKGLADRVRDLEREAREAVRRQSFGGEEYHGSREEELKAAEAALLDAKSQAARLHTQLQGADARLQDAEREHAATCASMAASLDAFKEAASVAEAKAARAEEELRSVAGRHTQEVAAVRAAGVADATELELMRIRVEDTEKRSEERAEWAEQRVALAVAAKEEKEAMAESAEKRAAAAETQKARAEELARAFEADVMKLRRSVEDGEGRCRMLESRANEVVARAKEAEVRGTDLAERVRKTKVELEKCTLDLRAAEARASEASEGAHGFKVASEAAVARSEASSAAATAAGRERDAMARELHEAREDMAVLESKYEETSALLIERDGEVERMMDVQSERDRKVAEAERQQNLLSARLIDLEQERELASRAARTSEESCKSVKTALNRTEKELSLTKEKLSKSRQQLQEALKDARDQSSDAAANGKALTIAKAKVEELEERVRVSDARIVKMEHQLQDEEHKAVALTSELALAKQQQDDVSELKDVITSMQERESDVHAKLNLALADMASLQKDKDDLLGAHERFVEAEGAQKRLEQQLSSLKETSAKEVDSAKHLAESSNMAIVSIKEDYEGKLATLKSDHTREIGKMGEDIQALEEERNMLKEGIQPWVEKADEFQNRWLKEMKWRKSIHDELLELKGNIRVFCRARPLDDGSGISVKEKYWKTHSVGSLSFPHRGEIRVCDGNGATLRQVDYDFDSVFKPSSDQEDVYGEVEPFIESFLHGCNVCVFAYGQTGSGKTFTMEGPQSMPGIIPRALDTIFDFLKFEEYGEVKPKWKLTMSVVDVYCEHARDLLVSHDGGSGSGGDIIRGSPEPKTVRSDTSEYQQRRVRDHEEVLKFYESARQHRVTASTLMNAASSRSHLVFSLHLHVSNFASNKETQSTLHLIDLAGSERVARSGALNDATQLKEAQAINKSLSALGDVINALKRKAAHIPFRNSKLTQILSSALGNKKSKTLMIAAVSPDSPNVAETICSLKFAHRVRSVELGPVESYDDGEKPVNGGRSPQRKQTASSAGGPFTSPGQARGRRPTYN